MKKTILLLLAVCAMFSVNAQDNSSNDGTQNFNEVKLNALYLVVGALELTYERTLNEESGVGASIFIPYENGDDIDFDINYYFSPYYRLYFGKKYAAGFFVEGFGLLSGYDTTEVNFSSPDPVIREGNSTAFALGIGVGGKWVTNSGFIGELNLGIGRNIINADDFTDDLVGKIAITVGYRF
ncbi:hypothetical protein BTO05_10155 [Winogradskyella sp. PC-19]|uniref:DUF3575 domain-containing protein n=1 Tax=unclassified Winogradskyella TaxID=2615021 RepID=UPI000B3CDD21|nr:MULTISPECIES: DUF3575 domain-containing protein [unclassified Winogradskyella]ARV09981.1 hypothetical protein BTO05_10155 [Winogradskyella sp. PC-19]RZN79946.1 MAG: DUF3575 domain-containing protein [Winogradskyella sp.]